MPERRWRVAALGLCAFAYLYVFPYQATLNNPNENVRVYMTAALAEHGTYAIDELRKRWGWVNDAAVHGGHTYSVKAPGTSLLGVPGYVIYLQLARALGHPFDRTEALWVCRVTASILPMLLFAGVYLGFLSRRGQPRGLVLATFGTVMLGSLLYGYGMLFVSHSLSAAVAFAAFAWLYEVERGERRASPLTAAGFGALAAATTWFEYPGLVATLVLTGYALYVLRAPGQTARRWKLQTAWLAGCGIPALSLMHFQWRAFDNPFTPGHLFVETAAFRAAHEQGVYGAVGPSWQALDGLLFDPGAGLFLLTPLLWLALPGSWLLCRARDTRAAGVASSVLCVLTTLAIASMNNWRGGWTIGPRYLAVCVPFLGFASLHALGWLARRSQLLAAGIALGSLIAAGVASGVPSAYYPHLPPEFTRPLPQLFGVLISHDYAPLNAGNWLGLWGSPSMVPLLACGVALCGAVLLALEQQRAAVAALALVIAAVCLAPLLIRPSQEPGVRQAVAFVTGRFHPPGHDIAARQEAQLKAAGKQASPEDRDRLRALYEREGRDNDAKRALRR